MSRSAAACRRLGMTIIARRLLALLLCMPMAAAAQEGWKNIPLGDATLSLDGQVRERFEQVRNPGFGRAADADHVWLQRLLLGADLRLGDRLRTYVQLGSWLASERKLGASATDESRADVAQAFVDLTAPLGAGDRLTLRLGRQEMTLGSQRLVSARDGPNMRRSFDGARAMAAAGGWRFDAFALRPLILSPEPFDDRWDDTQSFYGAQATAPLGAGRGMDLYLLDLRRQRGSFAAGTAEEHRISLGARLFGATAGWDWDLEAVGQGGRFGSATIAAWTASAHAGFTWDAPWRPRLGLKADVASGDGDRADNRLGTFNPLFPRANYFTEASLVGPSNLVDLQPGLSVRPAQHVELSIGWNGLWRQTAADALYTATGQPLAGSTGGDRFIGHQTQFAIAWTPWAGVELRAWYVHFAAGPTVEQAGGRDVDYLAASASFRF